MSKGDYWTIAQLKAIGGARGGLCLNCGWDLDSHNGLILDEPQCKKPKRQLPTADD